MTASDRQYAQHLLSNAERYGALHPVLDRIPVRQIRGADAERRSATRRYAG